MGLCDSFLARVPVPALARGSHRTPQPRPVREVMKRQMRPDGQSEYGHLRAVETGLTRDVTGEGRGIEPARRRGSLVRLIRPRCVRNEVKPE